MPVFFTFSTSRPPVSTSTISPSFLLHFANSWNPALHFSSSSTISTSSNRLTGSLTSDPRAATRVEKLSLPARPSKSPATISPTRAAISPKSLPQTDKPARQTARQNARLTAHPTEETFQLSFLTESPVRRQKH